MIEMPSPLEGKQINLKDLKEALEPLGYSLGGNWDYDHGSFDYKIADDGAYHFFRVPFTAVVGEVELGQKKTIVELGRPYLLTHQYQRGIDDNHRIELNALFNQFAEPPVKDGDFPNKYLESGRMLKEELEATLMPIVF